MAPRIRDHDWSATPLGPIGRWPHGLRTAAELMLASAAPVFVGWDDELTALYNDGYAAIAGAKHPDALGAAFAAGWPEVAADFAPVLEALRRGESRHFVDTPLPLAGRPGRPVSWFTFALTPLRDDAGRVCGIYCNATETTERVLADQRLRDSYRALADGIDQAFCVIEMIYEGERAADYRVCEVNQAFVAQSGLGDVVGRRMRAIAPAHEQFWYDFYGSVDRARVPRRTEHRAEALGRWFRSHAIPIGPPEGHRLAVLFDDITERKRDDAALREIEERQRLTIELVPALLWSTSADGAEVSLNEGWRARTGQSAAETQCGGWVDAIHPDDRPDTLAALAEAFLSGEPLERQHRVRQAGGDYRWHLVRQLPVRDSAGTITGWFGAAVDFHDSKLAELALRATERRLQTLIEGVPQLVWRAVDGGHWTWASRQWTEYTGQAEADSHDWGWLDPVHPDDRERVTAIWAGAIGRGEFHADYRICHRTEKRYRWFQTRATPVRGDDGAIIEWIGTSTDVDDLRQLQARQELLVAELQHRTRNLIGIVRSTAQRTGSTSTDLADFRTRFRDRLEALARVQGLLSRLEEVDRVDFDELIRSEMAALDGAAEKVALKGPTGIKLRSSTVQILAMALHELTTNALKHGALSVPQGRLRIGWHVAGAAEAGGRPCLHIDWREEGLTLDPGQHTARRGGGRDLIERALPYQLGAETSFTMTPGGVHCTIALAISSRAPQGEQ